VTPVTTWVRASDPQDADRCAAIAAALPDFFTADVPDRVRSDLQAHDGWMVGEADTVLGFAIAQHRGVRVAEILWAAVVPDRRGEGLGTQLIDHVLEQLRAAGRQLVEVKTLDASAGYAPYEATRAFWLARGFVQIDAIDPLPGWRPGNPAAILVAALSPTR
jgi:GNAT superfamily N-acetyltransferase